MKERKRNGYTWIHIDQNRQLNYVERIENSIELISKRLQQPTITSTRTIILSREINNNYFSLGSIENKCVLRDSL